jgi:hypothetical protein
VLRLTLFSATARSCWTLLTLLTILAEVTPRSPSLAPLPFYCYTAGKAALFLLIGLFSPLTFWRFDSLGLGLLFSAAITGAVEAVQSLSQGHRASYFELAAKLALLFIGFAYALSARYDGLLRFGPLRVILVDHHRLRND